MLARSLLRNYVAPSGSMPLTIVLCGHACRINPVEV